MFCPRCHCEYRPGFERCANCDVSLVADLAAAEEQSHRTEKAEKPRPAPGRMADFCGFFSLDEARRARDNLRNANIASEISIREAPESAPDGPIQEEYWLRFSPSDSARAVEILGLDDAAE